MTGETGRTEPPEPADPHALARDWITIWQSELAALAADREAQETWQKLASLWVEAAWVVLGAAAGPSAHAARDRADGSAGSVQPARAAPADAAPGDRDGEIAGLRARLDALEERLAELERGRPARAARAQGSKRRV